MKLNDIHYFIVIAEEKNISQAASRLYISQPALSQFLQKLERELDTILFSRTESGPGGCVFHLDGADLRMGQ